MSDQTQIQEAIKQLPPYPWQFKLGTTKTINGCTFVTRESKDFETRSFRKWELVDKHGDSLGVTAWPVYKDGTTVDIADIPPKPQNVPITPEPIEEEIEESFFIPEAPARSYADAAVPVMAIDQEDSAAVEKRAAEVDQAFAAAPFFWKDKELAAFAIDRHGDWLRHREMLEDAPLGELIRLPFAMLPDALRVLWFLSHKPEEWLNLPGMKEMETEDGGSHWVRLSGKERALILETKIRAWAAENVFHQEATVAVNLFYDIFERSQKTRAIAKPSEHHNDQKAKN